MEKTIQGNFKKIEIDSIADLRAIAWEPVDNQTISLLGYYVPSDIAAREFFWSSSSTATDNNGTAIKVTAITVGRWLSSELIYNVDFFGAIGGGGSIDTTAIIDTVNAAGVGGLIEFSPDKIYTQDNVINLLGSQTLDFNGSTLKSDDTMNLNLSNMWLQGIDSVTIKNIVIDGNRSARSGTAEGAGLVILNCDYVLLENVTINDANHDGITIGADDPNVTASRSMYPIFENIRVDGAYRNGISVTGVAHATLNNLVCINTGGAPGGPDDGIDIESPAVAVGSTNVRITNVLCNSNLGQGIACASSFDSEVYITNVVTSDNGVWGIFGGIPAMTVMNHSGTGNASGLFNTYGLDVSALIPYHGIIQTVRTVSNGADAFTAAAFADGTLSATITPKYASSAILGFFSCNANVTISAGTIIDGLVRIAHTGTPATIGVGSAGVYLKASGNGANTLTQASPMAFLFYDVAPAFGVPRTYVNQGYLSTGDQLTTDTHTIILMEIAAF